MLSNRQQSYSDCPSVCFPSACRLFGVDTVEIAFAYENDERLMTAAGIVLMLNTVLHHKPCTMLPIADQM